MKINKKLLFIPVVVAVVVFIAVYFYYYREDINSLTVTDKNWIEENVTSLVDIEVITDYPIYGDSDSAVFGSFISGFEEATGVEFNKISYQKEGEPGTKGLRFRVLDGNEELGKKDLLINEDVYLLISKTKRNIDHIHDISNIKVGVLANDVSDISYYLTSAENMIYKSYADSDQIFSALDSGSVDAIIVPHIMYLNKILSNEKNYVINYTLPEMSKKIVLTLDSEDTRLNDIVEKYFKAWKNNDYVEVYNENLFNFYVSSMNISDSDREELQSSTYTYGYVENYPYEVEINGELYGICGEYISRVTRLTGIDFKFKEYKSIKDLLKAVEKKEVDIYFNYYDVAGENYNEINSTFLEEFVVLGKISDSHVVSSFESLKGKEVSMVKDTSLFNYFKDNSKANITEYKDYDSMLSKSKSTILVVDKEIYTYYRNSKFKSYEVLFTDCMTKDNTFMVIDKETNFYNMFNYLVGTNSYYRYRNTALDTLNDDTLFKANSFEELYIVILILILVPIIFLIAMYVLLKRKSVVKKVRKEERRKYTDNLTSLKNRSYLNLNMEAWNKSEKYPQAVVMIDLNNVKYVNDNYGHEAGDSLIVQAASILVNTQLENSEIIRTDGNEFLIYLVGYSQKQVEIYTKKLTKEFKDLPYGFGAATGYSMITDDIKTIDDAINEAAIDMRNKKEEYK